MTFSSTSDDPYGMGLLMASSSTSNDPYREEKLGLELRIFLSYSGADKLFLWELYEDLVEHDYYPFFDEKSLPKAAPVSMRNIVKEAADSKLAVFCLSEAFFTRNQNPMMELVECVKNKVRLLPLFYEISVETIKKSKESWYKGHWSEWEVDRNEFKEALEKLLHFSGIENKEGLRPRQFRRNVVEEIQKIVPPYILPDVSGLCGGDRLVKVVKDMFDKHLSYHESTQAPAVVLGLYGVSGTGKSSLCKMLQHSEFQIPICYIALDETTQLERMKKALRSLTYSPKDLIDKLTKPIEAQNMLLRREYKKAFLIIDGFILSESLEEVRIYLDCGCGRLKPGSKVLITAHTKDVLDELAADIGGKWHIDAMPDLEKEEATQIFLKKAESIGVKEEIVERCLNLCRLGKGGGIEDAHYHPPMLNALAQSLLNFRNFEQEWIEKWLHSVELGLTSPKPIRQVLKNMLKLTGYNLLDGLEKQVFLDFAFYLPTFIRNEEEILEWLGMVHGRQWPDILETVTILKRNGLIDLSGLTLDQIRVPLMHGLNYEMATLIIKEKLEEGRECLLFEGEGSADQQLSRNRNSENIKRISYVNYRFPGDELAVRNFPSLEVLAVKRCIGVEKLDLGGADRLRSLDYIHDEDHPRLKLHILGLNHCAGSLVYLSSSSSSSSSSSDCRGDTTIRTSDCGVVHLPQLRYWFKSDGVAFGPPLRINSSTWVDEGKCTSTTHEGESSTPNPSPSSPQSWVVPTYTC